MAEIYSSLASPLTNYNPPDNWQDDPVHSLMNHLMTSDHALDGMRSVLHRYQRRSVAAMVQKELFDVGCLPYRNVLPDVFFLKFSSQNSLKMPYPYVQDLAVQLAAHIRRLTSAINLNGLWGISMSSPGYLKVVRRI